MAAGTRYEVTILKQPVSQTCRVSNDTGTAPGNNVTNIRVSCSVFVLATTPTRESTDIAPNSIITARFSSAINPATLTNGSNSSFSVSGVQGTVSMSADKRSAIFTPSTALIANTRYTATLDQTVQDTNQNNLDSKFAWSFTTAAVRDTTAPLVTGTIPAIGAIEVPTNSVVLVNFSEAINPATLTMATFSMSAVGGSAVSGSVVASADNRSATFTPNTALAASTNHTVTLTTGIKDTAGNALASNVWTFTAGAAASTTGPALLSVTPAADAVSQPVSTSLISATFNKPINCATVSTNSFQLLEAGVPVPGYTECNGTTLRFKPNTGVSLPGSTTLTASLDTSSKDLAGNAISAYTWTFGMAPWTRQLGTATNDYAQAITSDSNGNVYVTGDTNGALDGQTSAGGVDLFIVKYDSSGRKR